MAQVQDFLFQRHLGQMPGSDHLLRQGVPQVHYSLGKGVFPCICSNSPVESCNELQARAASIRFLSAKSCKRWTVSFLSSLCAAVSPARTCRTPSSLPRDCVCVLKPEALHPVSGHQVCVCVECRSSGGSGRPGLPGSRWNPWPGHSWNRGTILSVEGGKGGGANCCLPTGALQLVHEWPGGGEPGQCPRLQLAPDCSVG